MKNILVTQTLMNNESYFEEREVLNIAWSKLFKEIDIMPIVLPYEYDFMNYFNNLRIDGIILTGGNNLNSIIENKLSIKRDEFELRLIDYAVKESIPIFGVCRGMQIIAQYFGCSFKKVEEQVNINHKLVVTQDLKYSTDLNNLISVNSFHNYGIDKLKNGLLISATSECGLIKAIEHERYRIFAQMWHTERDEPFDKKQLALIKGFFQ